MKDIYAAVWSCSQVKNNTSFVGGDNTVKWIAYIKLKPTLNVTLPVLCVTASVWKDGCKVLESLGRAGRDWEESLKKQKKKTEGHKQGVFSTRLIGGRFNIETESFINREERGRVGCVVIGSPQETKWQQVFCSTVSEKQNHSQSVQG